MIVQSLLFAVGYFGEMMKLSLHRATSNYLYYEVSTVSGRCKPV